jgi:beta-glucanase (GH16 family)
LFLKKQQQVNNINNNDDKMKFLIYTVIFCLVIFFDRNVYSQNWQLVWSDEFDSTSLDLSSWTRETGGHGWGNNELQYYTDREVNSYLQDGKLIIKAMEESFGGRSYTSARLKTQNKKFWKYGKIEARMKLPFGQGIWPAFWMLGQNFSSVGWPACGEIDIMEMIGGDGRENTVYGTTHWDNNGSHAQYGGSYTLSSGTFADDFHTFRIEWNQSSIKWFVDNTQYHIISITPSGLSEFHQNFFIILNLAVGGNWPGYPDSTTTFPQFLEVDYIRVYQDSPTDIKDEGSIPVEFELKQNYPNPFNPSTTINFSLPEDSFVTLKIFNAVGSELSTLLNGQVDAGKHQILFNAENISTQVLFCQLTAESKNNDYISTKKMILLK